MASLVTLDVYGPVEREEDRFVVFVAMGSFGVAFDAEPMRAPQLVDLAIIQATGGVHFFLSQDTYCTRDRSITHSLQR